MMFKLSRWKNRSVRDLAWVIASPPLVAGEFDGVNWWSQDTLLDEYQDCLPILTQLDQHPEPLEHYLAALTTDALGHRFEALVAFWLELSPNYQLLDQSLQLQGEGRTLGELDFIIQAHRTGAIIHLEVAVKFYMGQSPLTKLENWYGSHLKDSFANKLNHLKQHQTQLSCLYPDKIHYPITQRCCMVKGRLFYPEFAINPLLPEGVEVGHLNGMWGSDVQTMAAKLGADAVVIDKQDWLSRFSVEDIRRCEQLQVSRADYPHGRACYVLHRQGQELIRYFQFPEGYFNAVDIIVE